MTAPGPIRVGVVEDDGAHRDAILAHLARYQDDRDARFDVRAYADGSAVIADYRSDLDLLLLDIEMPQVDGMTAAKRIREVDDDVVIVFITNAPQYALTGYEVRALSYLLKPVAYGAFRQELDRVLQQLSRRERRTLLFTSGGAHHRVDVADIVFLESAGHRVLVHTTSESLPVVSSLKAMEAELDGAGFARCNSGYLVALRHVVAVDQQQCRLRDGRTLQISRPRRKAFLAALADHVGSAGAGP